MPRGVPERRGSHADVVAGRQRFRVNVDSLRKQNNNKKLLSYTETKNGKERRKERDIERETRRGAATPQQ
jgi:hypothetical protein